MEYFNRDYYESQRQTEELLLIIVKQLEMQKSMLEALSVKVDNLTEFARKYENYNEENAETLIENFTVRPEEIDTLKEICDYIKADLSCVDADMAYNSSQIKIQEGKLNKLDADVGYNNSRVVTQEARLNKLENYAKAHWGYHPY